MAKKGRTYSPKSMTLPIAPLAGLAIGVAPSIQSLINGDVVGAVDGLAWKYCGWNTTEQRFDPVGLQYGLVPLVLGGLIHKFVGGKPIGINAMLARAGVPFIRL